jgi:hypothetical protein
MKHSVIFYVLGYLLLVVILARINWVSSSRRGMDKGEGNKDEKMGV